MRRFAKIVFLTAIERIGYPPGKRMDGGQRDWHSRPSGTIGGLTPLDSVEPALHQAVGSGAGCRWGSVGDVRRTRQAVYQRRALAPRWRWGR